MSFAAQGHQRLLETAGSWNPASTDYPGAVVDKNWAFSPHNPLNWQDGQNPYIQPAGTGIVDAGSFLGEWAGAIKEALRL